MTHSQQLSEALAQVNTFDRRFRVGEYVDVLMDKETGETRHRVLLSRAFVWEFGPPTAVALVEGLGAVLCDAIHLPPGVGG